MTPTTPQNRLASSSSAYLRRAAHQPVDWYEFTPEAFERARALDRPILLDVGAVWCHWCHVMDHESYENPEIARLINDHFVAIKVDRDQRPDVDSRYQHIVAQMTGHSGWPLTAFMTWEGRMIYGGTYFPPDAFTRLLVQLNRVYQTEKHQMFNAPEPPQAAQAPRAGQEPAPPAEPLTLSPQLFEDVVDTALGLADEANGGFGDAPKFPHYSTLLLLLAWLTQENRLTGEPRIAQFVATTLTHMAQGGMFDQLAGGFHRYATDAAWTVPHFEKLAYDNGEALSVVALAQAVAPNPLYVRTLEATVDWLARDLFDDRHGGFYASQDADTGPGDDGDFYTWTRDEIREALSQADTEADLMAEVYGLGDTGNVPARGRSVLAMPPGGLDLADLASRYAEGDADQLQAILKRCRLEMLTYRQDERPEPFIDRTLYAHWNGMLITGCAHAAAMGGMSDAHRERAMTLATRSFQRACEVLTLPGHPHRLRHAFDPDAPADSATPGHPLPDFVDDYAWLAMAGWTLHQVTGDAQYLDPCRAWADTAIGRFFDPREGGFYDRATDEDTTTPALGLLKLRRKPLEDSPSSSACGVLLRVCYGLYQLTGEQRYLDPVMLTLGWVQQHVGEKGLFLSAIATAAFEVLTPTTKIQLLGRPDTEAYRALLREAQRHLRPGVLIHHHPHPEQLPAGFEDRDAVAIVCHGKHCLPPVADVDALTSQIL